MEMSPPKNKGKYEKKIETRMKERKFKKNYICLVYHCQIVSVVVK